MTRACAAELSDLSFQLIDIDSTKALAEIIRSYPCSNYPELAIRNGQILKPQIIHTPISDGSHQNVHKSQCESFILQTTDPYRVISLSAVVSDECTEPIRGKDVEVQLSKICLHSSDYFPVSVSDLKFGQTLYWNKHTSQNHKVLALDFSGIVTAVGKYVKELKVGDHIVSCYPVAACCKVVIPADACYKTKRLAFLKDTPCLSYFMLAWEILHCALPKARHHQLGIVSTMPDSILVKVLTVMAVKSGWRITVTKNTDQLSHDFSEMAGIVLLPPYDEAVITKTSQITSVTDIILVADNQPINYVSQLAFRCQNNEVHMKILFTSCLMQKQSSRARKSHMYHWIKNMDLDRRFGALEKNIIQNSKRENIDCLPSESYFRCQTMPVLVLSNDTKDEPSDIPLIPKAKKLFQKHSVYIVTGGLSGLGFQTVKFIAQRGGGNIVILSRSGANNHKEQEIINVKNQCQCLITSLQCDVSISAQVHQAVAQINKLFPSKPIKGVFHSAVILHDGLIESLNKSLYEKVMRPKVNGVINLHYATKHCDLDYFVCYSSISAFLGNASQTNYAAANSFMDAFCQYRRNIGLPGQAINWGALNLGLLLNQHHFQRFLESKGMMILEVAEIHDSLEQCLLINKPQKVVCKFHFKNIRTCSVSKQIPHHAVISTGRGRAQKD